MVIVVITWVLWFFNIDVRNLKYAVKDKIDSMGATSVETKNPQTATSAETKNTQTTANVEDELITKCTNSYNDCVNILTKKYDTSVTILKKEKFSNKDGASDFYNTWKGLSQADLTTDYTSFSGNKAIDNEFPIVLFAVKVRNFWGQAGTVAPLVLMCDKNGELLRISKMLMQCGQ